MLDVHLNNKYILTIDNICRDTQLCTVILEELGLQKSDYYLLHNGRLIYDTSNLKNSTIHIVPKLIGGKGGFGSMLRAIGAQIEKTTNREACRDLSGRRLRDINEEKRLKNWIDQQAEREKEAADKKQRKLERLCQKPKHEFKDDNYDKERSDLPERLEDAIEQGLSAAASSSSKRKADVKDPKKKKKKSKLWLGDDIDSDISTSDDDKSNSEDETKVTIEKSDSTNDIASNSPNIDATKDCLIENADKVNPEKVQQSPTLAQQEPEYKIKERKDNN